MTSSEPGDREVAPRRPPEAPGAGAVTFSAVRRAEAQRIAAERAAAEKAAAAAVPPPRPALDGRIGAPVLVTRRPPLSVRCSQFFWILAIVVGAAAATYLFVMRKAHLPDIAERMRAANGSRADDTYTSAADIVSWSLFGLLVAVLLVQLVAQVSYANRRPRTRWWMLGTLLLLSATFPFARELVAFGDRGRPLEWLLAGQIALTLAGLLFSLLPRALRWTADRHDVAHRDPGAPVVAEL